MSKPRFWVLGFGLDLTFELGHLTFIHEGSSNFKTQMPNQTQMLQCQNPGLGLDWKFEL
jgi:hypothetical protein